MTIEKEKHTPGGFQKDRLTSLTHTLLNFHPSVNKSELPYILNYEEHFRKAGSPSRITKVASMAILDNSDCGGTYDSEYKEACDVLDSRLVVESKLQSDMLRQLRFKFATKIVLHEINVHARKMLQLAKELDKVHALEKMSIIVEEVKNREQHEHS
nr:hypothetical protein [Tanacetum cinerariifolium]